MKRLRIASLLAILAAVLALVAPPAWSDDLQEASRLAGQGQLDSALERINNYLSGHPKDAHGRFLKGVILAEQNKQAEAMKIFTALTEDYPELPEPYNNLAVLYAAQGQYDKARASLEKAIATHPSYATAHENLSNIYAKMASQAYDKALQLDKTDKANAASQPKLALLRDMQTSGTRPAKKQVIAWGKITSLIKPESEPAAPSAAVPAARPIAPEQHPAKPAPQPKSATSGIISIPAPKAETAKPKAGTDSKADASVLKTLNGWAKAWSDQDSARYLSYYSKNFKLPKGESRASWEKMRKERISQPKSIKVTIVAPHITLTDSTHATASFKQSYHANSMSRTTRKTLYLVKIGDNWLIQEERVGH